jgi:hypothetical protein
MEMAGSVPGDMGNCLFGCVSGLPIQVQGKEGG